ncbi:tubulin-binding prefolding complex subunit [Martiniozyma asiatica (nom. inval.)]|nr:tubulin-binding prefolding complex subunit [Martiniozyma asiatica]
MTTSAIDRLKTGETNPRGIPKAKFIENIDDYLDRSKCTEADVNNFLTELQMRLQQYKFLEENKSATLTSLDQKIPDIQNTLDMCILLKQKADANKENTTVENTKFDVDYQLNDTIYATAEIDTKDTETVALWLGAGVMLEYPIDEAIQMLKERLEKSLENKQITIEDIDYLRANITTMEVNTARVYNWDVQRRKDLKAAEESK